MTDTHDSTEPQMLSLRIENSAAVQLASWFQTQIGASAVREAARALTGRKPPRPLKVARALGLDIPAELAPACAPPLQTVFRHDLARRRGWQPSCGER